MRRLIPRKTANRRGKSMKKLLLLALAVSGLAFVPGQRADAQTTVGLPGVGGISFGFPGGYYAIPRPTIIIPMGTTGDRTTLILNHIRIITLATDTPGI